MAFPADAESSRSQEFFETRARYREKATLSAGPTANRPAPDMHEDARHSDMHERLGGLHCSVELCLVDTQTCTQLRWLTDPFQQQF